MGKRSGIWIDHQRAVIVTLASFGVTIERERSDVGAHQDESTSQRHKLARYFTRIGDLLSMAEAIYICGPDGAKNELEAHLRESPRMASRIVDVKPAPLMTDSKFVTHVRKYYEKVSTPRRAAAN